MTSALARSKELLAGICVLVGLYLTSLVSYLLFHSLVELFSIIVAGGIFMVAWNARRFMDNGYLLFMGIAFLFIGGIDLVHTLAYKGMGVLGGNDANPATQLWIAARYLQSISFLIAPLLLNRRFRAGLVFVIYSVVTTLLLASIFYWKVFPDCYVEGIGLTPFKRGSELVISFLYLISLGLLLRRREAFDATVLKLLAGSILASIASELVFDTYVSVYDTANLTGHVFKLVAFYLAYKAIIETGLVKPFGLVFRNMKRSEEALRAARDNLEQRVAERTAELRNVNAQLRVELVERKRAEEEVLRLNAELEQRVLERTGQLQAANEKLGREVDEHRKAEEEITKLNEELRQHALDLESTNKELEAFTYSVSHDLRAPLTTIAGFATLLMDDYAARLPEEGRHYVRLVSDSATEMGCLIEDLLAFSRASRQPVNKQSVSPADLVRLVVEELCREQQGRRIEFSIGNLPECQADAILLKQVYVNLISNALKFTRKREVARIEVGSRFEVPGLQAPFGGSMLDGPRAETPGGGLAASNLRPPEGARKPETIYYVKDNGAGFDMKQAHKLFGVFQRLHSTDEYEGTGIGLAIVERVIHRHGGRVWADGQIDQGAQFNFTLPSQPAAEVAG